MHLFGRREEKPEPGLVAQVMDLRSLVENLRSEVRQLGLELSSQSDLITKRMRRAVAAERAVEQHQEQRAGEKFRDDGIRPAAVETPARPPSLWGARGRIARRRALAGLTNGTGEPEVAEAED